jgi:hypothetical protein
MQKREHLSAKLLQTSSSSINSSQQNSFSDTSRITSYRNRSALPNDTTFTSYGLTARTKSNMALISNIVVDAQTTNAVNAKILQESNRILDDLLSNRRKSAETFSVQNSSVQTSVISRTSEEKALYPDKLILDRYFCAYKVREKFHLKC